MKDGGYDISDYMKIDPSFGTNEDFKELIECAKKAGIRVLMDLVVNHCSDQHEWFKQAVADPNSKYADYFIIEENDGEVPNNLRCYNGYSAWSASATAIVFTSIVFPRSSRISTGNVRSFGVKSSI